MGVATGQTGLRRKELTGPAGFSVAACVLQEAIMMRGAPPSQSSSCSVKPVSSSPLYLLRFNQIVLVL